MNSGQQDLYTHDHIRNPSDIDHHDHDHNHNHIDISDADGLPFSYADYQHFQANPSSDGQVDNWSLAHQWQQQSMHVSSGNGFDHSQAQETSNVFSDGSIRAAYQQGASSSTAIPPALSNFQDVDHDPPNTIDPSALAHSQGDAQSGSSSDMTALPPDLSGLSPSPTRPLGVSFPASIAAHYTDQSALADAIPRGNYDGSFLVVEQDKLSAATNSKPLNNFVNVGLQALEFPVNRAALPVPVVRRSRNQLYELARNNPALKDKISRRKHRAHPKADVAVEAGYKHTSTANANSATAHDASDYSSSDDYTSSDYESDEEPLKPSPLPAKRPESPLQATEYDAIKAVWRAKRNVAFDDVKTALVDFWDVVRRVRDRWKSEQAALSKAEEQKRTMEVAQLKSRVKHQRDMMEVVCKAALTHGHPRILELFAENNSLLFVWYQFLLDRHKEADVSSTLVIAIFKLLNHCHTITTDKLEKTHLSKLLPRFAKKGTSEIQALINALETAAKAGSTRAKADSATSGTPTTATAKSPVESQGVKRSATSSAFPQPVAKKIASAPTTAHSSVKPTTKPATITSSVQRPSSASSSTGTKTTPQASVTKVKTTTVKPSAFFSNVQSATKKTSNSAVAASSKTSVVTTALKKAEEKAAAKPAAPAAPKSIGFDDLLAGLTSESAKPKAPTEQKQIETEQEKAKRLRKEHRRTLRVTFKPDSALEEVRFFTHDPEEEVDHDTSMTRDLGDVGGEGRMLKQHNDMVDLDDDEDPTGQQDLRDYDMPSVIDFSVMDPGERARNYQKFGGGVLPVESPETAARDAREMGVFFESMPDDDSRPSPQEPTIEQDPEHQIVQFGEPGEMTLARAKKLCEPEAAAPQPSGDNNAFVSALLGALQSQPRSQPDAHSLGLPGFMTQAVQPAQSAAHHVTGPSHQVDPGLINSLLSSLQPSYMNGAQANFAAAPQGLAHGPADFSALLSSLNSGTQSMATQQGQQPPFGAAGPYDSPKGGHWLETTDDTDRLPPQKKQKHKGKFKQRPCKYYQEGTCRQGENCTFLHE